LIQALSNLVHSGVKSGAFFPHFADEFLISRGYFSGAGN
jgi:hypothetical protein